MVGSHWPELLPVYRRFNALGALAEFERSLVVERTNAGLEAAKARGQKLGRKRKLDAEQLEHAKQLIDDGK